MCYELLMGRTPFHSYELKDLIAKINRGDYTVALNEPISIECALFLTQCLQANESDRISAEELINHQFLNLNYQSSDNTRMTKLDKTAFTDELIRVTEV